jgi:hypothetical protein
MGVSARIDGLNSRRRRLNSSRPNGDDFPSKLPQIRLRHGQALWLLTELGYSGAVSESAFFEYIKSLRKLGIPFGNQKFQSGGSKRLARYSFFHLMELATTLSLRVYHVVPDAVLRGMSRYRGDLYRCYRRAYTQRRSGAGKPILIKVRGYEPIELRGLFLDLNIQFAGGHLVHFGPPKLLSSTDTLAKFSEGTSSGRAFIPLSLSLLSERVILLALRAPEIRSGPPKSSISRGGLRSRQSKPRLRNSSLAIE